MLHRIRRHFSVEVYNATRPGRLKAKELTARRDRVSDREREMRLPNTARGVDHNKTLLGQPRRQNQLARRDIEFKELRDRKRPQPRLYFRARLGSAICPCCAEPNRRLDNLFDCRGTRKLRHVVKVLEIIRAVWTELGNRDYTANCSSRFLRLRYAGVTDGAIIVVGEHDDPGFRKLGPERFGNGAEVAAIERDRHRVAGGFVRAGTCRVTLADQDHVGRSADGEVATPDATAKEELLAAVFSDELQAVQQPFGIPNRHHDVAARNADAMRPDPLAVEIRVLGAGRDIAPDS